MLPTAGKNLRGKIWKLPNGYWRACNHLGQQCTFKIWNEAKAFTGKGRMNESKYYVPSLSKQQINDFVSHLVEKGWNAKASSPYLFTNAPKKVMDKEWKNQTWAKDVDEVKNLSEVNLRGWNITDKSYITRGADPTRVTKYTIRKGTDYIHIEEFFNDWYIKGSSKNLPGGPFSEKKISQLFQSVGAPSVDAIDRAAHSVR